MNAALCLADLTMSSLHMCVFDFYVPAAKGASILNMGQPHMIHLGIGRSLFLWNFSRLFLFSFSVFSGTYKKNPFKTRSGLAANSCWQLLSGQSVPQEKFNSKLKNYKYCQEFLQAICKPTDDSLKKKPVFFNPPKQSLQNPSVRSSMKEKRN